MSGARHLGPYGQRSNKPELTPRQTQIAPMIVAGLRDKEIAQRLATKPGNVRAVALAMYKRIGVHGRFAFICWYNERHSETRELCAQGNVRTSCYE